jgi:phosphomannomutase
MQISPGIFKAYDIRGLYPGEINEPVARQIGRGFVAYLQARRIGVSRDMRVSSPALAAAFIEGAREQGASVIDYGMLPTDVLYFAVATDGLDGGAQLTASHNPNSRGIKMVRAGALPEQRCRHWRDSRHDCGGSPAATAGTGWPLRATSCQVRREGDVVHRPVGHHTVPSCSTPAAAWGLIAPLLFDRLPCRTTRLCFTIDGNFPTHEANPLIEENRQDITAEVVKQRADIGIAWDGDADRCFFIDGSGEFISGDFVTALLAEAFLLKQPHSTVIYYLRASHAVRTRGHWGKA